MRTYLEFEKSVAEIENKIEELAALAEASGADAISQGVELSRLKAKAEKQLADIYAKLDPWQKTQVARHQDRPRFRDYVGALVTDFIELSGDRKYGEDAAILGGTGKFMGRPVVVVGHEKGRTTQDRLKHNFGMARPEGYRKAVRLMDLAEKFSLPVVSFVDTAGAYPGIGAEERGQGEAIARSTERCVTLGVPMVAVVTGEGGSGGAIAIATGNKVLMLEHAIYSVISPEAGAYGYRMSNPPVLAIAPLLASLRVFEAAAYAAARRATTVRLTAFLEHCLRVEVDAHVTLVTPTAEAERAR